MKTGTVITAVTGTGSIGMIEAIAMIPGNELMEVGKLLLQLVVAIGTVISMYRKNKGLK